VVGAPRRWWGCGAVIAVGGVVQGASPFMRWWCSRSSPFIRWWCGRSSPFVGGAAGRSSPFVSGRPGPSLPFVLLGVRSRSWVVVVGPCRRSYRVLLVVRSWCMSFVVAT
jgi:hypothetical protein